MRLKHNKHRIEFDNFRIIKHKWLAQLVLI
jgi:hypothetical protein